MVKHVLELKVLPSKINHEFQYITRTKYQIVSRKNPNIPVNPM